MKQYSDILTACYELDGRITIEIYKTWEDIYNINYVCSVTRDTPRAALEYIANNYNYDIAWLLQEFNLLTWEE